MREVSGLKRSDMRFLRVLEHARWDAHARCTRQAHTTTAAPPSLCIITQSWEPWGALVEVLEACIEPVYKHSNLMSDSGRRPR